MSVITGTVRNGLIVLDDAANLPDGSRVVVHPIDSVATIGVSEAEWPDTPEAIADWITWHDSLEAIELSATDEQALEAFRLRQKELGEYAFDERLDRLQKIWQ